MLKHNYPGLFIAFEGLDGSGSSTQAGLLSNHLNQLDYLSFVTKEPTNNMIGGLIRGILTKEWKISNDGAQLLFAADRAHHLDREIVPGLKRGNVIITDRYAFSSIAFGSLDCDTRWLASLNEKFIIPDITFLIKVSPKECLGRIRKARNEFELFEENEKLERVWKGYVKLAGDNGDSIVIIDGEREISAVADEIFGIVNQRLKIKPKLSKRENGGIKC